MNLLLGSMKCEEIFEWLSDNWRLKKRFAPCILLGWILENDKEAV
jgi:hypothetical protein